MFAFRFRPRWFSQLHGAEPLVRTFDIWLWFGFAFGFGFIYVWFPLPGVRWFGLAFFILASAFDLRCLIAGVVCGRSWLLCMQQVCVNAFAHAAHKFLATFYVAFAASSFFFSLVLGFVRPSARNWKQRGVAAGAAVAAVAYCGIWILNFASSPSWLKLLVSVQCPTTAEMQRIGHRLPGSYWLKYPRCRLTPNVARGQAMPCNLSKLAAILGCFILLLLLLLLLLAASGSANKKWGQN